MPDPIRQDSVRVDPESTVRGPISMTAKELLLLPVEQWPAGMSPEEWKTRLHVAQKMETLGRLACGVAHDFNNLLTVIRGYSEILIKDLEDRLPEQAQLAGEIRKAAEVGATFTHHLLAYGRLYPPTLQVMDLGGSVPALKPLFQRLVGQAIDLAIVVGPDLSLIRAVPGQIEQVFMNLVLNARDAMPAGGRAPILLGNPGPAAPGGRPPAPPGSGSRGGHR